ncbi:hypothetical protein C8Q79DRAFT_925650 [Trametes meyenii]|nr:hypothetical protein C8Q79DRAFT_925650 [Trametes meyenii]
MTHYSDVHNAGSIVLGTIPRPAKISHSLIPKLDEQGTLASQMRLHSSVCSLKIYCHIMATIAVLADEHGHLFDVEAVKKHSATWKNFLKTVLHQLPIIKSYEDAWPVIEIVREHRRRSKNPDFRSLQHLGARHTTDLSIEKTKQSEPPAPSAATKYRRSNRISLWRSVTTAHSAGPPSISGPVAPGPDVRSEQSPHTESLPIQRRRASRTPDPVRISSPQAVEVPSVVTHDQTAVTEKSDAEPVAAFLSSLFPDQSALLSVLVAAGITDSVTLDGLARMDARNKWLYGFVREGTLTELQFVAIQTGLDKMMSG